MAIGAWSGKHTRAKPLPGVCVHGSLTLPYDSTVAAVNPRQMFHGRNDVSLVNI